MKYLTYDFHDEAVTNMSLVSKGQVILPTGTGKSRIEARAIEEIFKKNQHEFMIALIITPRILLTNQLMKNTSERLAKQGISVQRITTHSGHEVAFDNEYDIEVERLLEEFGSVRTTSSLVIKNELIAAKKENRHVMVCSTYHSLDRVVNALPEGVKINITLCDEAHNIVNNEDFFKSITAIQENTKQIFFLTATQKNTAAYKLGRGMNNVDFYGPVICTRTPRWAIDNGYIVRPRLHLEFVDGPKESEAKAIIDMYYEHKKVLSINPKILINCSGTKPMLEILNSNVFKSFVATEQKKDSTFKVFDISSTNGANINYKKVEKENFLQELNAHDGSAIVFHIRILTEGIDVPDFTGNYIGGSMKQGRFIQTNGRAARLHTKDRQAILDGYITPGDLTRMKKPYSYVCVPVFNDSGEDLRCEILSHIENLRGAGFDPAEDVIISVAKGVKQPEQIDLTTLPDKKMSVYFDLFVKSIHYALEDERIASLREEYAALSNDELLDEFLK